MSPLTRGAAVGAVGLLAGLALLASPASAAGRRVPQGFYGVMWDGEVTAAPRAVRDAEWDLMARSGVESVRTVFSWAEAQPTPHAVPNFEPTDALLEAAARRRMQVLPVVVGAPQWARQDPTDFFSAPSFPSQYATFLDALVDRYGTRGSFWRERGDVPRRPIRDWQIWNEPHLRQYWSVAAGHRDAWPAGYVRLLRASYRAVKRADGRARVVLAGLTNDSWNQLAALYRRGARRYFDVGAIQTFTHSTRLYLKSVRAFRTVMRRFGDRRKPLWATELTWPASRGRTYAEPNLEVIGTTELGMAARLARGYRGLVRLRGDRRYRVDRAYWYTWASPYRPGPQRVFEFSGLSAFDGERFTRKPALLAYIASARRDEGCVKTSRGTCARRPRRSRDRH